MMELTFEDSPWEQAIRVLHRGDTLSAARFLALMEGEPEDQLEAAFDALAQKQISLDVAALPACSVQGPGVARLRLEQELAGKADMRQGLEENDPLRLYLEELAGLPVTGDVQLLAQQYLAGEETAAKRLSELSLSMVIRLAKDHTGCGVLLLDLIQEGSLGLWQGILCYEGGDFEHHRDWWISHYMQRAVVQQAKDSGLGQKLRQAMADYRDTDQRLLTELGRNPTTEEIAEAMHVTPEDVMIYADMLQSARQQAKIKTPEPELPQEEQQAVEDTAYFQMRQRILELLSVLSEKDAQLLTLRYGLEGGMPLTPEETGRQLGLTPNEVVAAEAAALAKLRTQ